MIHADLRVQRHHPARGHGAPARHGRRPLAAAPGGAGADHAHRLLAHPGLRRHHRRGGRPGDMPGRAPPPPRRPGRQAPGRHPAPGPLRCESMRAAEVPARDAQAQEPHGDRDRRVRRHLRPGHHRGPAGGDRGGDRRRVRPRGAQRRAAARWRLPGASARLGIDEVNELLDVELPRPVGLDRGLLFNLVGGVPPEARRSSSRGCGCGPSRSRAGASAGSASTGCPTGVDQDITPRPAGGEPAIGRGAGRRRTGRPRPRLRALLRFPGRAALLTEQGDVIAAANVENASYGLAICAERSAVVAAVAAGSRSFLAIAVAGNGPDPITPCPGPAARSCASSPGRRPGGAVRRRVRRRARHRTWAPSCRRASDRRTSREGGAGGAGRAAQRRQVDPAQRPARPEAGDRLGQAADHPVGHPGRAAPPARARPCWSTPRAPQPRTCSASG